ncbi:hypothetical protein [Rhodanobacter koreensis]
MSSPLLCIGHSHVACVARAAEAAGTSLQALNFWEMPGAIQHENGTSRLSVLLEQRLKKHTGPVFSMIGGAAHGVLGMLVHPRRFDFVLPAEPALPLDPAAEVLPALAVRHILESLMVDYLTMMSQVHRLCAGRLFHLESPPPLADAQRMQADIPWGMYPGMCHEISPAHFRYKLWRLHSQIVGDWCARAGATFVPCPPQSVDENGFMRESYYGDGAHANTAYGELVLEQMRQLA